MHAKIRIICTPTKRVSHARKYARQTRAYMVCTPNQFLRINSTYYWYAFSWDRAISSVDARHLGSSWCPRARPSPAPDRAPAPSGSCSRASRRAAPASEPWWRPAGAPSSPRDRAAPARASRTRRSAAGWLRTARSASPRSSEGTSWSDSPWAWRKVYCPRSRRMRRRRTRKRGCICSDTWCPGRCAPPWCRRSGIDARRAADMLSARPSLLYTSYRARQINADWVSFICELLEKQEPLRQACVRAASPRCSSRRGQMWSSSALCLGLQRALRSRVSLVKGSLWTALCWAQTRITGVQSEERARRESCARRGWNQTQPHLKNSFQEETEFEGVPELQRIALLHETDPGQRAPTKELLQ